MVKITFSGILTQAITLTVLLTLFIGGMHPAAGSLFTPPWDKVAHICLYFALFFLLHAGYSRITWRIALFVILIGAADELHQTVIPTRHAGWDDLAADCAGVLLAIVFQKAHLSRHY